MYLFWYLQFIYLQIISDLQSKVARLENELSRAKSALDQANNENQELNEELERVKSNQPLALILGKNTQYCLFGQLF